MRAPTGEQFELSRTVDGVTSQLAITQVGAAIRVFTVNGIDLTEPYPEASTPPSGAGVILVPWPNRVKDGRWDWNGKPQQLALTEPARQNAIHGLLRYTPYRLVEYTGETLRLAATVFPQPGYPFLIETTVQYELTDDGLSVQHQLTNDGEHRAPVAVGAHPYLKIGDVPTGELVVSVDAATHFTVDDRANVVAQHPVSGTEFDLRSGAVVGDLQLDDGWADVGIADGEGEHVLRAPDGRRVSLWGDSNFSFVQVFTSRAFATQTSSAVAIAIEPMTAPANALNSGVGLRWLEPGETWSPTWGIRHSGFRP